MHVSVIVAMKAANVQKCVTEIKKQNNSLLIALIIIRRRGSALKHRPILILLISPDQSLFRRHFNRLRGKHMQRVRGWQHTLCISLRKMKSIATPSKLSNALYKMML